jgi:hypothetical protein
MIAFERLLPYAYCGSLASVAAMAMKEPCASLHVGTGRRLGEQSARGCRQPRLRRSSALALLIPGRLRARFPRKGDVPRLRDQMLVAEEEQGSGASPISDRTTERAVALGAARAV